MTVLTAIVLGAACTTDEGRSGPPSGQDDRPSGIDVTLRLPADNEGIVGPATGRVWSDDGDLVATFEFATAWIIPEDFNYSESPPTSTSAAPTVAVHLPEPGTYHFELDPFTVSGSPCGTCERFMGGGEVQADVDNGETIELPAGDLKAES